MQEKIFPVLSVQVTLLFFTGKFETLHPFAGSINFFVKNYLMATDYAWAMVSVAIWWVLCRYLDIKKLDV